MLQQTTVAAVIPRFERFVQRWPTLAALAAAEDADVLSEWAGLGYYARARNLIACARIISATGGFPSTAAELRKLPGIGAYTSSAIAAIAFGEAAPAVDTNIARVISRLYALANPSRAELESRMRQLIAAGPPGDVVQGMMDLGATICVPREPRCGSCPLRAGCAAFATGEPERFPLPKAKRMRPQRFGVAYWTERDDAVWLVRRAPRGLLGGMAALPGDDWSAAEPTTADAPTVRHVFTHFALELAIVERPDPVGDGWWQGLDALGQAGLPTLYKRAVAAVLEGRSGRLQRAA